MKIRIVLLLILLVPSLTFASPSMRRCLLLPIQDNIGGALSFKVFEEVENYLKNSDWCYYRSNSSIMDLLGNYNRNLQSHLANKSVLRLLAEKTKSGSLIKIEANNIVKGVEVKIKVIGHNGEDIYFKEETKLDTEDVVVIGQTIKNWLDVYEKTIPYDGRIIGVLGDQFTVDMGRGYGIVNGSQVSITRPRLKKRHPLLKEVVDWETLKIADAKVFHVTKKQSQGMVSEYESNKRLHLDDWVNLKESEKNKVISKTPFSDVKEFEFGKLGHLGVFFNIGTGSATITDTDTKKIGGLLLGVDLLAELWATRNYWGSLEIGRKVGTYKKKEGTLTANSNSVGTSRLEVKGGYRYLPLGFFYGPQVDGYLGYAKYDYELDTKTADGWTEVEFKGILMGVKGSIPLEKLYRVFAELSFIFNPEFDEESAIFGEEDGASNFGLEFGGQYNYSPSMTIDVSYNITTSKAKFVNPTRSLKHKESNLKVGSTFTF
ncbi:MAG: hypothetical protein HN509_11545 [Halobacteriovoraceae bacterium]|jgi:hypothetical protein|nr:hypothetical protein [Halobacteriovoraceae bacterium]MBT5093995.1 hypothetical protein [Halobacteriovoraceae bacterium]